MAVAMNCGTRADMNVPLGPNSVSSCSSYFRVTTYFACMCTNLSLSLTPLQFRMGVKLGLTLREEHRLRACEKMLRGSNTKEKQNCIMRWSVLLFSCTFHMFVKSSNEGDETLIHFGRKTRRVKLKMNES